MKRKKSLQASTKLLSRSRLLIFLLLFVIVSGGILLLIHAAGPSVGKEAESGSSPTTCNNTSGASGGACIRFCASAGCNNGGFVRAIAIGDMACGPSCANINAKTSALINNAVTNDNAQYVLLAGDIAYSYGSGANYQLTGCQHPSVEGTWNNGNSGFNTYFAPLLSKTNVFPAVGNHEYYTVSQTVTYDPVTHHITSYSHQGTDASCKLWPSQGSQLCDKYGNNCVSGYKADPLWPYFHVFNNEFLAAGMSQAQIDDRQTYYSFNIGNWHIVSVNSSCRAETYRTNPYPVIDGSLLQAPQGCGSNSPEVKWLQTDLASSKAAGKCSLAYFHRPYVSEQFKSTTGAAIQNPDPTQSVSTDSPWEVNEQTGVLPNVGSKVEFTQQAHDKDAIWQALYDNNVDVVVNGHEHDYYRYHNVNRAGTGVDGTTGGINNGIEEIVVGTGGPGLTPLTGPLPSSTFMPAYTDKWGNGHNTDERGVMQLDFYSNKVHFKYLSVNTAPGHFTDEGDVYCH